MPMTTRPAKGVFRPLEWNASGSTSQRWFGSITQISAAGGVMILGLGVNMVMDAKIKVANLLPGLVVAVGYYFLVM